MVGGRRVPQGYGAGRVMPCGPRRSSAGLRGRAPGVASGRRCEQVTTPGGGCPGRRGDARSGRRCGAPWGFAVGVDGGVGGRGAALVGAVADRDEAAGGQGVDQVTHDGAGLFVVEDEPGDRQEHQGGGPGEVQGGGGLGQDFAGVVDDGRNVPVRPGGMLVSRALAWAGTRGSVSTRTMRGPGATRWAASWALSMVGGPGPMSGNCRILSSPAR